LKHPDEAETLRQVYGSSFFLIAAYAPHNSRRNNLARGIAQTRNEYPVERHYAAAEALMNRDQEELGMPHGQNLRDTFHRADVRTRLRAKFPGIRENNREFSTFSVPRPHCCSLSCTFQGRTVLRVKIQAGNFRRRIRESDFVNSEPCRESCCWRRTSEPRSD
jgi:hypothetical protein